MAYVSPYTTRADVQSAAGGERRLIQLTDSENTGNFNQAELEEAQKAADALIDSYVQRRHRTPVEPAPQVLRMAAAQETVYQLQVRRQLVPPEAQTRHEERLAWLKDVSTGVAGLGVEPERVKSSFIDPAVGERSPSEPVSRSGLKGLW